VVDEGEWSLTGYDIINYTSPSTIRSTSEKVRLRKAGKAIKDP
jgi:hypothetical protein